MMQRHMNGLSEIVVGVKMIFQGFIGEESYLKLAVRRTVYSTRFWEYESSH